jgi:hypothetical protein
LAIPNLQFTFSFEHFPRTYFGLLNFIVLGKDILINPSDDGLTAIESSHSIYVEIMQSEIGQFVGSPF